MYLCGNIFTVQVNGMIVCSKNLESPVLESLIRGLLETRVSMSPKDSRLGTIAHWAVICTLAREDQQGKTLTGDYLHVLEAWSSQLECMWAYCSLWNSLRKTGKCREHWYNSISLRVNLLGWSVWGLWKRWWYQIWSLLDSQSLSVSSCRWPCSLAQCPKHLLTNFLSFCLSIFLRWLVWTVSLYNLASTVKGLNEELSKAVEHVCDYCQLFI